MDDRSPQSPDGIALRRSESLRIPGGISAPRTARLALRSLLADDLVEDRLADLELIVSELVTNSVRHAAVDADDDITVDVLLLRDRVRLSIADSGSSQLPRIRERDAATPGGLGLPLVEELSTAWGVARDGNGVTRVWSELALTEPF